MTQEFDEDNVQSWTRMHHESRRREERPYRQCPNCNKYKFRAIKALKGGIFSTKRMEYEEKCKNCKYKGETWDKK